jgi:16S rRNA pseudouridine516 synthase
MTRYRIDQMLSRHGYCSRGESRGWLKAGRVTVNGEKAKNPADKVLLADLRIDGEAVDHPEGILVMLHKPAGTECSRKPSAWPSIYSLLPAPLRQRPQKGAVDGVQAVGRLDQDTTGLLLLSDDGQFIHRMASPRHHVPKVYQVHTVDEVTAVQIEKLLAGVVLDDDPQPVRAAACQALGSHHVALTLTEGKYHQVKRMLAAVGNRVQTLHRSSMGGLHLPENLLPGQWRWLTHSDLQALGYTP